MGMWWPAISAHYVVTVGSSLLNKVSFLPYFIYNHCLLLQENLSSFDHHVFILLLSLILGLRLLM